MGNTKVYTVRFPLIPGESLITRDEIAESARTSAVIVGMEQCAPHEDMIAMIMVESNSMSADDFVDLIRTRYPNRHCIVTRYDADWTDFRVTCWADDGTKQDLVYKPT